MSEMRELFGLLRNKLGLCGVVGSLVNCECGNSVKYQIRTMCMIICNGIVKKYLKILKPAAYSNILKSHSINLPFTFIPKANNSLIRLYPSVEYIDSLFLK